MWHMQNYAAYLPLGVSMNVWQVGVTAAGFTRIPPHAPYPPGRHPLDHLFTWERGRVLDTYQIIYISEGGGTFEAKNIGRHQVVGGTVILLFPGVWHRYRPDAATGWVESWIELQGPAVKRLETAGVISAERPLYRCEPPAPFEAALDQCHHLVASRPAGYAAALGTLGLQILAWLDGISDTQRAGPRTVEEAVQRAQELLTSRLGQIVRIEPIAEQFGVSYSALRHGFKTRVGMSPKQYHLDVRLRKACELLRNTDLSISQISDALGFASAYHLSSCFKSHMHVSPSKWRQRTNIDV